MKKIIFTIIIIHFLLCLIQIVNAQWYQQNSGTTADLYNIKFINRNTGFCCGGGVILKTTNSGTNWILLNLPVNKMLFKIYPVDSSVIYCVGMFETIIKSTNGGTNWQVIRDGPNYIGTSYHGCCFINRNTGWIAAGGLERKILKTTNGCQTFDSIVTLTSGNINDIYFKDSVSGLYCDDNGAVRKSTNGGYNWFSINIPVGSYSFDFQNFTFINNLTGWTATFSRQIFKTTDFGNNWDSVYTIPNNNNIQLHSIFFSSNNTGYACGSGFYIYKSTNSGYNWIECYLPYPINGANSIFFVNDSVGWKVTNSGKITNTTNGGQGVLIAKNEEQIAKDFVLYQNYPNPFNNQTLIRFSVKRKDKYKLEIFNLLSEKICDLLNNELKEGSYEVKYSAENLSSGIYIYRLSSDNKSVAKKLIIMK